MSPAWADYLTDDDERDWLVEVDPTVCACGHSADVHEDMDGTGACMDGHANGGRFAVEPFTVTCSCDGGRYPTDVAS